MSAVLACTEPEPIRPADTHAPDSPDSGDSDSTGSTGSTDTGDTGEAIFAVPDDPYLLSLHTCPFSEESCGNPMNHTVRVAGSEDGATWRLLEEIGLMAAQPSHCVVGGPVIHHHHLVVADRCSQSLALEGTQALLENRKTVVGGDDDAEEHGQVDDSSKKKGSLRIPEQSNCES